MKKTINFLIAIIIHCATEATFLESTRFEKEIAELIDKAQDEVATIVRSIRDAMFHYEILRLQIYSFFGAKRSTKLFTITESGG